MTEWRRAILESPFSGDVSAHRIYALRCLRDMFERGEAGFASHLIYPLLFSNSNKERRKAGLAAGAVWTPVADCCIIYRDMGMTEGMIQGKERAELAGVPVMTRYLDR